MVESNSRPVNWYRDGNAPFEPTTAARSDARRRPDSRSNSIRRRSEATRPRKSDTALRSKTIVSLEYAESQTQIIVERAGQNEFGG